MDTATEISKLTIDPDGDVVLVLDSTELQVSSKVLSVASSVFKAMFGPHFQEGQDLSATSPKRISLPEDNTAAMSILCNIFHHQSHNVNKGPNPSTLAEIGTLCDKYNCSEALQSWIRTWLGYYQRDMSSTELEMVGVTNLLYPFYVFNHPESFKQISIMTVYCAKGFINKPLIGGSLPDGVLGKAISSGLEEAHELTNTVQSCCSGRSGRLSASYLSIWRPWLSLSWTANKTTLS